MTYINLHTHHYTANKDYLEVVNQYPWAFEEDPLTYSIGIHPWYLQENRLESDLEMISKKIKENACLALGECGLDKRIEIPLEKQIKVFKAQLGLIQDLKIKKPIILHCVAAYQEVINIKKELNIENPMIIHGFSKNTEVAQSLINNGFYLSFGKYLLRNPDLSKVFLNIPDDRFFLETDTIEETIEQVYERAAAIKKRSISNMVEIVKSNYNKTFQNRIE